jgi:hypothetical protein
MVDPKPPGWDSPPGPGLEAVSFTSCPGYLSHLVFHVHLNSKG